MEDVTKRRRIFLSFSKLGCGPQEINSTRFEKRRMPYQSYVFATVAVAVAVVDSKGDVTRDDSQR